MQQLLVAWLLIGVLLMPADQVGLAQAIIGVPGIFLLLWGGAAADRSDPRRLLIRVYAMTSALPLILVAADQADWVSPSMVTAWGLAMATAIAFTSAPQLSILNRIAAGTLQQGVTTATAIQMLTQIAGLAIAGQMERIGLTPVLLAQTSTLLLATLAVRRLPAQPMRPTPARSASLRIVDGLRATMRDRVVFNILLINFVSAIFNAGAFMTVFPFIIKRIYEGDAWLLAMMLALFYACAMLANVLLLKFMPLARPGRLFLVLQLSRLLFLGILWLEPDWWLFIVAVVAWGANMGVTTTLARTIVQESAAPEFRARILSVYNLGLVGSPPLGALVLGWIIETFGTLNALLPGMITCLALFAYGVGLTGVWTYRSPESVA